MGIRCRGGPRQSDNRRVRQFARRPLCTARERVARLSSGAGTRVGSERRVRERRVADDDQLGRLSRVHAGDQGTRAALAGATVPLGAAPAMLAGVFGMAPKVLRIASNWGLSSAYQLGSSHLAHVHTGGAPKLVADEPRGSRS